MGLEGGGRRAAGGGRSAAGGGASRHEGEQVGIVEAEIDGSIYKYIHPTVQIYSFNALSYIYDSGQLLTRPDSFVLDTALTTYSLHYYNRTTQ